MFLFQADTQITQQTPDIADSVQGRYAYIVNRIPIF